MQYTLLISCLILSINCFASQDDNFENEYLKLMEESNLAQNAELRFNEMYKDKNLNQVEKIEEKRLKCDSLMNELRFYHLINKYPKEYTTYIKRQGLKTHLSSAKINNELKEVKRKVDFYGCDDTQINY